MTKYGIDVSEHQGYINWSQVSADFCIIRAGYGKDISQKDKCFEANYKGCKANNIHCGAYWYSYAVSAEEARLEAAACLEAIKGKQLEYPVFFDIEEQRQLILGRKACSEIASAFLETVENAGYFVGIYSSKDLLESYISEDIRTRYTVWVAQYGVNRSDYIGSFGMWQKSGTGRVAGISVNVDLDECYIDYPSAIISNKLNGFSGKESEEKEEKDVALTIDGKTFEGTLTEK